MTSLLDYETAYNNGEYNEAIEGLNIFLLMSPDNNDALFLRGKCWYELALLSETDADREKYYSRAVEDFDAIIQTDAFNEQALLYRAYIHIYINPNHRIEEAINDCSALLQTADDFLRSRLFIYRSDAFRNKGLIEDAIRDRITLEHLYKQTLSNNLAELDNALHALYCSIGDMYLNDIKDTQTALSYYEKAIKHRYKDVRANMFIAKLAFENNHPALGCQAAFWAFSYNWADHDFYSEEEMESRQPVMSALYGWVNTLVNQGEENEWIHQAYLRGMRVFREEIFNGKDKKEIIFELFFEAKKIIEKEPQNVKLYEYAGIALFEGENYEPAIEYFQKSIALGGITAYGFYRYIMAHYYQNGTFLSIETMPYDNNADEWYCVGLILDSFYKEDKWTEEEKSELAKIRALFYKESYTLYYDYFYHNQGNSHANERHFFAMCCNNYGIALSESGREEDAIPVHIIGYTQSPFIEQLTSLGRSYHTSKRDEEAIENWETLLRDFGEGLDFRTWFEVHYWYAESLYALKRYDEALKMTDRANSEYTAFMKKHERSIDKSTLERFKSYHDHLLYLRSCIIIDSGVDLNTSVQNWENELSNYPDNRTAYYQLFQNYFELKQYEQSLACLKNYTSIHPEADWDNNTKSNIYYKQGRSLIELGKVQEGVECLNKCSEMLNSTADFYIPYHLGNAYHILKQWEPCLAHTQICIDLADKDNYPFDSEVMKVYVNYIDAAKQLGYLKDATAAIEKVLQSNPTEAVILARKSALSITNEAYLRCADFIDSFVGDTIVIGKMLDEGLYDEAEVLISKAGNAYDIFIQENKQHVSMEHLGGITMFYNHFQWLRQRMIKGKEFDADAAIAIWENEYRKYDEDMGALLNLHQLSYAKHLYNDAILYMKKYEQLWPSTNWLPREQVEYNYQLGASLIQTGDIASSITALQKALKSLEPDGFYTFYIPYYLCYAYLIQKDYALSIENGALCIQHSIVNNFAWSTELESLYCWYADAMHAMGNSKEALRTVKQMLEYAPDSALALERTKIWKNRFW